MIMSKDWINTIYVWDGILSPVEADPSSNGDDDGAESKTVLKWEGTWVGCDAVDATKVETPKRGAFNEFVTSDNKFEVTGTATKGDAKEIDVKDADDKIFGGDVASLYRVAMTEGPGWDMGDGEEKKKHTDIAHDMYFSSLRWTGNLRDQVNNIVFAIGHNEFGHFVSVGWLRVGNRVTLARRYLDESDGRTKWDIDDLRKAVFDQIATVDNEDDGRVILRIPPWQCAAMHANESQISKRQKTEKN
ncbi:hypothetical protein ACHAXS_005106 [Conticribra weissflogii]